MLEDDAAPVAVPAANPIRVPLGSARAFTPTERFPEPLGSIVQASIARSDANLAVEFSGITSDGVARKGLFPLRRTGVSVFPIVDAATRYLATLDDEQRGSASFGIESENWRKWHNMHIFVYRHGICLFDLTEPQKAAALDVLAATLSAAGFENARDVMKLNEYVAEVTGRTEEFGEWYYYLSVFGTPSETKPWGWQIDGHHLIINCFILGDQIVLTPYFSGSEPVVATCGKYAGTRVFEREEQAGLRLMQALSPDQRRTARIGTSVPREVHTIAQVDNLHLPYAGITWDAMTDEQRELLWDLVGTYVGRMRPEHGAVRMEEVREHLAETYFGWIGGYEGDEPFYYRIHSPVILIEFDHLPGIVYDNVQPSRAHVHTIVRTPNGNDYGHDLLRQHYLEHDHSHPESPHLRGIQ